jgi:hypothetical protein
MLLRDLLLFRRTSGGYVPPEVLKSLDFPMPDDVVEQFVKDHGTKGDFQKQYGHLDLHAVAWDLKSIPASELLACSVFPRFAEWVDIVADRTRVVPIEGWKEVRLPRGASESWRERGTWLRSPVMISGEMIGSANPLHLVEGHTRLGALRGLVEAGVLPASSEHEVWIGRGSEPSEAGRSWREVLGRERMSFLDWVIDQMGDDGRLEKIAMRLVDLQHNSRHSGGIRGDDLAAVRSVAERDAKLAPHMEEILMAHQDWERIMTGL